MQKPLFAIFAAVMVLSGGSAYAGPYPYGDEPYRLDWGYDPPDPVGLLEVELATVSLEQLLSGLCAAQGLHVSRANSLAR